MINIQKLSFSKNTRVFYCSDLHGMYDLFLEKAEKVCFDKDRDVIICTGDLVDRGDKNIECLRLLEEPWFYTVRGNHEDLMYNALMSERCVEHGTLGYDDVYSEILWKMNGGRWYYDLSFEDQAVVNELLNKVKELPEIFEVEHGDKTIIVCHANFPEESYPPSELMRVETVLWDRNRVASAKRGKATTIHGADLFVFGHTLVEDPLFINNQLYIDTGAYSNDNLTIMESPL